jgi:hypothetical protein
MGRVIARNQIRREALANRAGLSEVAMNDNRGPTGKLGLFLGVLIAIAAVAFLLNGGENLGKKSVKSDADLPPVTSGQR